MTPKPLTDINGARALALVRRFDHHRSHLAGRRDQARQPGGQLPQRASGAPRRVQQLWRAARQSSGDDARHLRQHPHPQPHARRRRGRHDARARRRDQADLRRGDGISGGGRPAGRAGGQGIWHRIVARLGGQGHHPARRPRRAGRELRAHPPLQSGRHGRDPAAVSRRRKRRDLSARRDRDLTRSTAWPTSSRDRTSRSRSFAPMERRSTSIARCRIDTYNELEYFRAGGILQYVLRNLAA